MENVIAFTPEVERRLQIDRLKRKEFDQMERIETISEALAYAEAKLHQLRTERQELEVMAAMEADAKRIRS